MKNTPKTECLSLHSIKKKKKTCLWSTRWAERATLAQTSNASLYMLAVPGSAGKPGAGWATHEESGLDWSLHRHPGGRPGHARLRSGRHLRTLQIGRPEGQEQGELIPLPLHLFASLAFSFSRAHYIISSLSLFLYLYPLFLSIPH